MILEHIASKDLNLLVVFAALLEERNVTRAGRRLGLTQPATSRALARLRDLLGDPLFVRGKGGLLATARAEAAAEPLRAMLERARDVIETAAFDPAIARRSFALGMADLAEPWLLPRLLTRIAVTAPGVDLVSLAEARPLEEGLEPGRFDLAVVPNVPERASLRRQALLSEDFVCLLRRDHPALSEPWSAKRFAALGHVLVAPRGTPGGIVDRVLGELGLARRVVVHVGSFGTAPVIVAATDLVTTLPRSLAQAAAARLDLIVREPPMKVPGFTLYQCWHERVHADPAHAWLRREVLAASEAETASRAARGRSRRS